MADSVLRHRRAGRSGRMAVTAGAVALAVGGGGTVGYFQLTGGEKGCTGAPVEISVVASPDHYPIVNELTDQWNDAKPSVGDRCVSATVRAMPSSAVAASIGPGWDEAQDGPRPDVWSPDFSAWLSLAAGRPDAAGVLPQEKSPSLASSPTVIAMQRPMAEALGWPGRALGWTDLIGAFQGGKTWADHGHPEWGPMRLGMADPTRSGAGLATAMTIMDPDNNQQQTNEELYIALSASQLTTTSAEDPAALLRQYTVANNDDIPTLPAAIPVLERELAAYADDAPRVPLVPVYPKEGAAYADYPFTVLRAPWVDDVRRQAAAGLLAYLQRPESHQAYEAAGFRDVDHTTGDTRLLSPDRGFQTLVAGPERTATAEALTEMLAVWGVLQRSNNALLLLDVSGSMNDQVPGTNQTRLQLIQNAAIAGAGLLNNGTVIGLWAFATDLTPTTDYRELVAPGPAGGLLGGVPRRQAVAGAVQGLRAAGGTGLYDTIGAAYDRMQKAWKPNAQNMVVVMTDGKNEDESGLSLQQLLDKLKASARPDRPLPVLAIAVGPKADATALEEITKVTGGRTFVERNDVSAIQQIILAFAGRVS
ncbi:substrate-binding and VWA domain-containing protein [Phytohabitans suffuscus]|uniref:VWA domain-containing protein n=1 Tax=Phytohabitans suffuscus TaxID=624315 RepID=A0A6F8YL26_9ACTN|nr:substrate-binding and VWA domain-containing protein [Phytohabitans suffuscus]BCB86812.1 VWA domain-containing protein [Phytohabitans suffuscus]